MKNKKLRKQIVTHFDSQANFAMEIGEQEALVSRVIHGRVKLGKERQMTWAEILNCKKEDIFS